MKIFSKRWFTYRKLVLSEKYSEVANERIYGVDFESFDLFNNIDANFIFIHIPKVAGLSVINALTGKNESHHATALDYKKQKPAEFDRCYKFSMVRNPSERCFSAYNYLSSGGRLNVYDCFWREEYIKRYKSFERFVMEGGLEKAIKNNAEHFIPQWKYLYEEDKCIVDYVGRLEHIEEFVRIVSSKIEQELCSEKINTGKRFEKSMPSEVEQKIQDLYLQDYLLFGYGLKITKGRSQL